MASTLISEQDAASALDGSELLFGDQGGADVKITVDQLADFMGGVGAKLFGITILGSSSGADEIDAGWKREGVVAEVDGTLTEWFTLGNMTEVDSIEWDIRKNGTSIFGAHTPAAVTEDFEDETDTATTFQYLTEPVFTLSGVLAVGNAAAFFAGGSDYGVDTYAAGTQSPGTVGSITIAAPNKFIVNSLKAVVSEDTSVTLADGSIKFTGTLAAGGTATETLACNSSGGWQTLSFSGALDGVYLTALEIEIPAGSAVDYVGVDDFEYTYAEIPVRPAIDSDTDASGTDLYGWVVDFEKGDIFTFNPGSTGFTFAKLGLRFE